MTKATDMIPTTDTIEPETPEEICQVVREAGQSKQAIYPVGGATSLDYGLPAKTPGLAVSLRGLQRVVDYPARDMTITVEAGATMRQIKEVLAAENQRLPIDVPDDGQATLGGVIATNWNGPRWYGQGSVRDYVIGVSAVDGHGTRFRGGGRVVKNVAGYDLCKLMTGSLGTLAIITEATMKVKPIPAKSALAVYPVPDLELLETALAGLVQSQTTPMAMEVVSGGDWQELLALNAPPTAWHLIVGLEGTDPEVSWMIEQLDTEMRDLQLARTTLLEQACADAAWEALVNWSVGGEPPLVLQAQMLPSGVSRMCQALRDLDATCALQCHAGNGVVIAKFDSFPEAGLSRCLLGQLQPLAASLGGNVTVLSNPSAAESTRQSVWGGIDIPYSLMARIKQQFDPHNILNPGRFVYP